MLFGKGPDSIKAQEEKLVDKVEDIEDKAKEMLHSEGITDPQMHQDIQSIVDAIWKNLKHEKYDATITSLWHNTVYRSDIYELSFPKDWHECVITFNDLPWDDNFTSRWDMDGNQDTPDDIYEFMIDYLHDTPESGIHKFTIKRWHPTEMGTLHFRDIDESEARNAIAFVKKHVMKIDSEILT